MKMLCLFLLSLLLIVSCSLSPFSALEKIQDKPEITVVNNENGDGKIMTVENNTDYEIKATRIDQEEASSVLVGDKTYVLKTCVLGIYFTLSGYENSETTFVDININENSSNPNYYFLRLGNPNGEKVLFMTAQDVSPFQIDSLSMIFYSEDCILRDLNIGFAEQPSLKILKREKISLETQDIFIYIPKLEKALDSCFNDFSSVADIFLFYFHGKRNRVSFPNKYSEKYTTCDLYRWDQTFIEKVREKFSPKCTTYSIACNLANSYEDEDNTFAEALSYTIDRPVYASDTMVYVSKYNLTTSIAKGKFHILNPSDYNADSPCIEDFD